MAPHTQGQRRNIVAVYLDPSNFKNIGDGHTMADQINEVLEPYDLGVLEASNDRIGGWQLMYQMLKKGQWQIADTCPKLIKAIPTRMHDEKKPGDVLKVPARNVFKICNLIPNVPLSHQQSAKSKTFLFVWKNGLLRSFRLQPSRLS